MAARWVGDCKPAGAVGMVRVFSARGRSGALAGPRLVPQCSLEAGSSAAGFARCGAVCAARFAVRGQGLALSSPSAAGRRVGTRLDAARRGPADLAPASESHDRPAPAGLGHLRAHCHSPSADVRQATELPSR